MQADESVSYSRLSVIGQVYWHSVLLVPDSDLSTKIGPISTIQWKASRRLMTFRSSSRILSIRDIHNIRNGKVWRVLLLFANFLLFYYASTRVLFKISEWFALISLGAQCPSLSGKLFAKNAQEGHCESLIPNSIGNVIRITEMDRENSLSLFALRVEEIHCYSRDHLFLRHIIILHLY